MKNFEYAAPTTEAEALKLLLPEPGKAAILAGGADLVGLMKRMIETPQRVVYIGNIASLRQIHQGRQGELWVGAAVHLDEFFDCPSTRPYPAVNQVIGGIGSLQAQSQGTVAGELFSRPACWYYRNGHGLLGDQGRGVVAGDNRYHAILGNQGPAKFVSPSRLAPALIALGASVRVIGPGEKEEQILDLERMYRTPRQEGEREHDLLPNQLITHVILPPDRGQLSAAYEVRHGVGPDPPLAAAAVAIENRDGLVRSARIVLGQVAPTPWLASRAARTLVGQPLVEDVAEEAALVATSGAMPLAHNEYKIQLAQVAVRRAILRAAGIEGEDAAHGLPALV